jgi:transcriptional regulator with XRE-family HTH domain
MPARKIRLSRLEQNLSQAYLADVIGISPAQLSKYERGIDVPNASMLKRIAQALGIHAFELLYEKQDDLKNDVEKWILRNNISFAKQ